MRIIAGEKRGAKLKEPEGDTVRPTSDKVRGALFNVLAHAPWATALRQKPLRVADLFCGTGALGLEALSRGAEHASFVDAARESLALAKINALTLKLDRDAAFLLCDARDVPSAPTPFDLLFLDPPYNKNLVSQTLPVLREKGWLRAGSVLVAETGKKEEVLLPQGFLRHDHRAYGVTAVHFLEFGN